MQLPFITAKVGPVKAGVFIAGMYCSYISTKLTFGISSLVIGANQVSFNIVSQDNQIL